MTTTDADTVAQGAERPPAGENWTVVPEWLVNLASLGWRVLVVAALVVVLWALAAQLWIVTASIAVSVVIAAAFAPFVLRLRQQGRSRTAAAAIVWVLAGVVIVGILVLLLLAFLPYVQEMIANLASAVTKIQDDVGAFAQVKIQGSALIQDAGTSLSEVASGIASEVAGFVTVCVLATFLVFFFLKDGDRAWTWMFQEANDEKRQHITDAGRDALLRVGGYLRGTTILSGIIALTDFAFMLVLGVPLALPLAVLVFVSGYIPYFGGIVTTFIVLAVTWGAVSPFAALVMVLLIAVRNAFLSYWVRPQILGRSVNIHPALVLLVLPAGFQLAGIIGLFAAVPVTAVLFAVASATRDLIEPDVAPPLPDLVPSWLDRVAQWSWRLLVGIGLVGTLTGVVISVPLVILPIVIALIVAATAYPGIGWMEKRGHPRTRSAAILVGGGFLVIVAVIVFALVVLVDQVGAIVAQSVQGAQSVDGATGSGLTVVTQVVQVAGGQVASTVATILKEISSFAVVAVLGCLLAFYLLKDGARLWARIMARMPAVVAPRVQAAGTEAFSVMGGYMLGTAAISFVGGFSQFIIMLVLGLPLALPVFVLSFFLCFIPYIGGFISTGIAFLIAVAVGSTTDVIVMIIWTLVFNIVTGNIVSPLVYGKTVHLHPAVVLVAIPAASAIAGIIGMFVVVPAIGVVSATWRTVLLVLAVGRGDALSPGAAAAPAEARSAGPPEPLPPGAGDATTGDVEGSPAPA